MRTPREVAHAELTLLYSPNRERLADLIEQARADGVIEAYAALIGLRTRYSMTEMADAMERACTALSVDLTLVRDRIPPG